jgi:hypothetical protein
MAGAQTNRQKKFDPRANRRRSSMFDHEPSFDHGRKTSRS